MQLSTYRPTKPVEAAKIEAIPTFIPGAQKYGVKLEGFSESFTVSAEWLQASSAQAGGYLIRHPDGSLGFCPAADFEDSYELVEKFSEPKGETAEVGGDAPLTDEQLQEIRENQRRAEYGYSTEGTAAMAQRGLDGEQRPRVAAGGGSLEVPYVAGPGSEFATPILPPGHVPGTDNEGGDGIQPDVKGDELGNLIGNGSEASPNATKQNASGGYVGDNDMANGAPGSAALDNDEAKPV